MIWDRLRRESNTKAQSLMFECVCVCVWFKIKIKRLLFHIALESVFMYAFVLDSFPLLCLYVWLFPKKKKKLTKNQNDRIIAFGETNIIVNKRIVERLWTKKEKNFDFASPFFSLISIFMSKRNLKKKIEVYMMCQNSSILLILPILAPKRRWNKIHLGLWLAKYDACARWKHKCIALIFPETKPLKLGVFFFFFFNYILVTT